MWGSSTFLAPPLTPLQVQLTPHAFNTTLVVCTETAYDGCVTIHERRVAVYVLPEPWITSGGPQRQGSYNDCRMIHNKNKPFEGILDIIGDLSPALFRGVWWDTVPTAPVIQGNSLQTRMTIPYTWWQNNDALRLYATIAFVLPGNRSFEVVNVHRAVRVHASASFIPPPPSHCAAP